MWVFSVTFLLRIQYILLFPFSIIEFPSSNVPRYEINRPSSLCAFSSLSHACKISNAMICLLFAGRHEIRRTNIPSAELQMTKLLSLLVFNYTIPIFFLFRRRASALIRPVLPMTACNLMSPAFICAKIVVKRSFMLKNSGFESYY